jgi:hypothetical protein
MFLHCIDVDLFESPLPDQMLHESRVHDLNDPKGIAVASRTVLKPFQGVAKMPITGFTIGDR